MELKEVESVIEGILFAAGEPVGVERLCMTLEIDRATADAVCQRLADQYSYERRGIRLVRLESAYQLCSAPEYADYIRKAFESRKPARLSQPALEVLSIIAYYQPTTKAYVDQIRGVDSSYTARLQEAETAEAAADADGNEPLPISDEELEAAAMELAQREKGETGGYPPSEDIP